MAKRTFHISPKLIEEKKVLPVQAISVAQIQQIVKDTQQIGEREPPPGLPEKELVEQQKRQPTKVKKAAERPQGRPRREEKVIRISSDLPEDLYNQMKIEININGYTMNGFLANVLRAYFDQKNY